MSNNYPRFLSQRIPHLSWYLLEMLAISFLALLFNAHILSNNDSLTLSNLDPRLRLDTIEHERLSGILIPVQIGLGLSNRAPSIGHLPAWNPYLGSGTPLINNGFFYLFNPFISLPVLLHGGVQGTKLAVIIGLVMSGYSMWFLARAIGLGSLARVAVAAFYVMNGGLISKLAGGHFQLGLSLVWPPLVFAGLWWTLNTRARAAPVLMALAFALLLFSGNIYYTLHVIVCCVFITVVHLFHRDNSRCRLDWLRLRRVAAGGLLALGLSMIQFLPLWMVRDYVGHPSVDFAEESRQLIEQIDLSLNVANFVTPWDAWQEFTTPPVSLFPQVHYNYIGPGVFLLIGLLAVVAPGKALGRYGSAPWIALVLLLLLLIWGAGQTFIVADLYRSIPLLAEFRFLGRANAIAALWWILLAGIALDSLWRLICNRPGIPDSFPLEDRNRLLRALVIPTGLWLLFLLYSVSNNSTRLALSLNNLNLFNALNERRFLSYPQATDTLILWILLALLLDTLLLLFRQIRRRRALRIFTTTRLLRAAVLIFVLVMIVDLIQVNSPLMQFEMPEGNFGSLYAYALSAEQGVNPFPSIQEPYTPLTYDAYYSRVRSWGLNEGWIPYPLEGDLIPPGAPKLLNFPGWGIVTTEFGLGASYNLARQFVESNRHELKRCAGLTIAGDDPCDLENQAASALYQLPDALPYAFVASEETLRSAADSITSENAQRAAVLSHQLDTIVIEATSEAPRDYLIVQETHFPGWRAWVDDTPVETITIGNQIPQGPTGGFVGLPMQPGTHRYTLRYEAPGFNVGLLISVFTLLLIPFYLFDFRPFRRKKEAVSSTASENSPENNP